MQQLGVILTPYGANSPYGWYAEITKAVGGNGRYLPQPVGYPRIDRFHQTRGEVGYYYDTQLGNAKPPIAFRVKLWIDRVFKKPAPTAPMAALPRGNGATPSDAELAKETVCYTPVQSGWVNTKEGFIPGSWKFGWNPAGAYGPPTSLGEASATDAIAAMNAHNQRMFQLAVISTAAVSLSALFTLWTRYRRLRLDLNRKRKK